MSRIDPARWQELSPLLDQALELEGAARTTWLESLRARQADLAQDIQLLLLELQTLDNRGFMQGDASSSLLKEVSLEGHALGVYTLESALGRGGMGTVWLARRNDGRFEGKVAIKLLNLALIGREGGQARFRREGRVLGRLTHPNIARILDAGVTAAGQMYLVLEYVEGSDIERYCTEQALSIEARIKLFLDVLAAVGHAHANLIVHRDIKPSNIFVTREGVVKLLDFGVAKLLEEEAHAEPASKLTRDGVRALTPQYAAPEQVLDAPITVATDVYALGVLLYVLLSGEHPTSQKVSSTLQHLRSLLETEPLPLSVAATSKKLKRALRGDLDNILAKTLKKNPQQRYASVREFAEDLTRYLRNEPVLARSDSAWYRVAKFLSRNRLPVALGAAALVAVLGTATVALREANSADKERDRALTLSSRNEAVAEFLSMLITEAAASGKPVAVSDMLERSEALVRSSYRGNPEHRAAVMDMLALYYGAVGNNARAESLVREALESVRASTDQDLRRRLTCNYASMITVLGKEDEAVHMLNAVIAEPQIAPKQAAECLDYLTQVAIEKNNAADALKFANLARQRLHQAPNASPLGEALLLNSMGYAQILNGHNDLAGAFFERSLAKFASVGRERKAEAIAVRNNWAIMSSRAGNPRRALELYEQSLQMVAQNDPSAPPPPYIVGNRARSLESLGRYRESVEGYSQCVAVSERAGALRSRANCLMGLASATCVLGDIPAAEGYLAQLSAMVGGGLSASSTEAVALPVLRGRIALAKGELARARAELDIGVANNTVTALTMSALLARAQLSLIENKWAAAQADAQQMLKIAQGVQGGIPHSNHTGNAWLMLGRALEKQGDSARAQAAFRAAVDNLSHTVDPDHPMLVMARQLVRTQ